MRTESQGAPPHLLISPEALEGLGRGFIRTDLVSSQQTLLVAFNQSLELKKAQTDNMKTTVCQGKSLFFTWTKVQRDMSLLNLVGILLSTEVKCVKQLDVKNGNFE